MHIVSFLVFHSISALTNVEDDHSFLLLLCLSPIWIAAIFLQVFRMTGPGIDLSKKGLGRESLNEFAERVLGNAMSLCILPSDPRIELEFSAFAYN